MLTLQAQGDLHLGVEDHLASSLTTGESRPARTLPRILQANVVGHLFRAGALLTP